ncbi:type II CAAX endopeptidase family protein [Solibacillus sp. FSL R7-0682]|uniref:CPBP family intramembrane glutamic endopeptidase n=1 Tax=Solibacillus sp. FSL R7-0682 TaxID=2921690 RepID=UPI0030F56DE0
MDLSNLKKFKIRWFVVFAFLLFIGMFIISIFAISVQGIQEWITLFVSIGLLAYVLYQSKKHQFVYSEAELPRAMSAKSWGKYLTLTASLQLIAVMIGTFLLMLVYLQFENWIRDLMEFILVDEAVETPIFVFVLFFINVCILAPLWEELFFRGILLRRFMLKWSPQKSIIISSLLFGIIHLNPINVVFAFFLGCVLAFVYLKTKSIIVPMILHSFSNFLAFIQYYLSNQTTAISLPTSEDAQFAILVSGIAIVVLGSVILFFIVKYYKSFRSFTYQNENSDILV